MAFKKTPEGDKGLSHSNHWGKSDAGRRIMSTKVLGWERAGWHVPGAIKRPMCQDGVNKADFGHSRI